MGNTIGQFDFDLTGIEAPLGASHIPIPMVHICLKRWGKQTRNGAPIASLGLMSEDEIDHFRCAATTAYGFCPRKPMATT